LEKLLLRMPETDMSTSSCRSDVRLGKCIGTLPAVRELSSLLREAIPVPTSDDWPSSQVRAVSSTCRPQTGNGKATGQRLPIPTRQVLPSAAGGVAGRRLCELGGLCLLGGLLCGAICPLWHGLMAYGRLVAVGLPSTTENSKVNGGSNSWLESPIIRISMLRTRSSNWYASVLTTCPR